jgi:hypothetical protein
MRARPARRFDLPGNPRGRAERAINLTVADTGDSWSLAAASIARARQSGNREMRRGGQVPCLPLGGDLL